MPTVDTGRKQLSNVLTGYGKFQDEAGVDYYLATVDVEGSAAIEPIGTPLVWVDANSAFEVYLAQDIAAVTGSPLPDESPICITVGTQEGLGFNKDDVTLSATAVKMTVLFRGEAGVLNDGIEWGAATAPNQAEFIVQLEKQGITVKDAATTVVPTYV